MNAYIYRAALYCEDCADEIAGRAVRLGFGCSNEAPSHDDRSACDSECAPEGPYAHGGGEADTPQHCDACGVFLENPLTSDGVEYVREEIRAAQGDRSDDRDVLEAWIVHYADALAR